MEKLAKISAAELNGIISVYSDVVRPWMDDVNEDDIYTAIANPEFGMYVDGIVEDALEDSQPRAI